MKIFKPTRGNLHPNIVRTFEEILGWHVQHGYKRPNKMTVDRLLAQFIGFANGKFVILVQDGGKKHHGNASVMVFNKEGVLIDDRIYFNPVLRVKGGKIPQKAFIGTPIIDGSKPMKFRPLFKNRARPFCPPV